MVFRAGKLDCQKKNITNWFAYRRKLVKNGKNVGQSKEISYKRTIKKEPQNQEIVIAPKLESNPPNKTSNNEGNIIKNFSNSTISTINMGANFSNTIDNLNNNLICCPNFRNNWWVAAQMQNLQRVLHILDSPRPIFPQAIFQQYRWNS